MAYEVQTYTLADGWINCWTTYEENGDSYPTTFDTVVEAQDEIDQLRAEWPHWSQDEYRIVEVKS